MRTAQSVLTDFLNHGILPFVGREETIERLMDFRRGTVDAFKLRSFLLVGEAGIGKSRLVEEVIPKLEEEGGAVAHLRLRPASTGSPVALLADVLWNAPTVRPLLRGRPGGSLDAVVDALRRLCRLRPTVIVVEDIHLLAGETLRDFATLLNVLADDPVSLIFTARPLGGEMLSLLEPSLVAQDELAGLRYDDIALLGSVLFGPNGAEDAISVLTEATLGNPLAIRSALRGALRQETILRELTGGWRGDERFSDVVRLGARSITEGLAVHLTPFERSAADALASLGEIFSLEAAEILLKNNVEKTVESLVFKGILVRSSTVAVPLPRTGRSHYRLFAFTHTLVHHTLIGEGKIPAMQLLEVLECKAPLYSIVPFERLADVVSEVPAQDRHRLAAILLEGLTVVALLDETSEWTLARLLLNALERIVRSDIFPQDERIRMEVRFVDMLLRTLERDLQGEEFGAALERFFALIPLLPPEEASHLRIRAFAHQYKQGVYDGEGDELCQRIEKEVNDLVAASPGVIRSEGYVRYLGWRNEWASLRGNMEVLTELERHTESLIADPDLPDALRNDLQSALHTSYLVLVRTPEEYAKRVSYIELADRYYNGLLTEVSWLVQKARFYGFTGDLKRQWEAYRKAILLSEKRGQKDIAASLAASLIKCRAAMGLPLEEAADILRRIGAIAPEGRAENIDGVFDEIGSPIVVNNLVAVAVMNGRGEWGVSFYDRYFNRQKSNPTTLPILLALYRNDPAGELEAFSDHPWLAAASGGIVRLLRGGKNAGEINEDDLRAVEEFLLENLSVVPIATRHILHLQAALRLHALLAPSVPYFRALNNQVRDGLLRALEWGKERELWPMIDAYVREYGELLTSEERRERLQEAEALREANRSLLFASRPAAGKSRLSMFGVIRLETAASDSDEEPVAPRGRRLKTLLGVMVANEILARPLEREEFLLIASGHSDDPKHARDIVNKTVSRLREGLGNPDIILTDGDTPRLNREVVDIDILEAMASLSHARDAVRRGALMKGAQELKRVLELWNGEVPYPALYDEFFETLREEFESSVRSAVLLLAQGLLQEGDNSGAEYVLRRLYAITPEDAEVGELLVTALEADGRKVEAMRTRQENVG